MQKLQELVGQLNEEVTEFEHTNYKTMAKPSEEYIEKVSGLLRQTFTEVKSCNIDENKVKAYSKYIKYIKEFYKLENKNCYEFVKIVFNLQIVLEELIQEYQEKAV